jgi:hypothetical protein
VRICNVTWISASASALALSALYGSEFATPLDATLRLALARRRFFEQRFRGDFLKGRTVSKRSWKSWPVKCPERATERLCSQVGNGGHADAQGGGDQKAGTG